jgi:hypothetical protein
MASTTNALTQPGPLSFLANLWRRWPITTVAVGLVIAVLRSPLGFGRFGAAKAGWRRPVRTSYTSQAVAGDTDSDK